MIQIKMLYFAQLKDALKKDEEEIELKEELQVGDFVQLWLQNPLLERYKTLPFRFAINEEFVSADALLKDQCTLVLIPPVAGG